MEHRRTNILPKPTVSPICKEIMATLPTKESFIQNKIDAVSCGICQEDFDKDHTPVQLETCKHVFGHHCILNWFESDRGAANTCPNCRTVLFQSEDVAAQGGGNNPYDNSYNGDEETHWNNDAQYGGHDYDLEDYGSDYNEDAYDVGRLAGRLSRGQGGEEDAGSDAHENESGNNNDDELEDEDMSWLVESGGFDGSRIREKSNDSGRRPVDVNNPSWNWRNLSENVKDRLQ